MAALPSVTSMALRPDETPEGILRAEIDTIIETFFTNGGLPATPYDSYSDMVAAGGVEGSISVVMNDADLKNNGYWLRRLGVWVYAAANVQNLIANKHVIIITELTKKEYVSATDSYLISHKQLDIFLGSGLGFARINAATDIVIAKNTMYYVDIATAKAGDVLTPQVTPTDWASASYGTGSFVRDSKIPLFTYRDRGIGGLLADKQIAASAKPKGRNEPVWFKTLDNNIVKYDTATRTLSWSGSILMPTEWSSKSRVILPAHSITFANTDFQVAWVDLRVASQDTFNVADAVKISKYTGADAFLAKDYQVPIFYFSYYGQYGSLSNFFASDLAKPVQIDVSIDEPILNRIKKSTAKNTSIYQRSGDGFIEFNFERETVPFDGVSPNGNLDCWRIKGVYDCDIAYTRGLELANLGAWEAAIMEQGKTDYSGTYHGDEVLTDAYFIVSDKVYDQADAFDKTNVSFEFVQKSKLYRQNTTTAFADMYRHYKFSDNGFTLEQKIDFISVISINSAMIAMIPAKRKVSNTTGAQITDSGLRMYDGNIYKDVDMTTDSFARLMTPASDGFSAKLWGKTSGYSFGLELIKTPNLPNANFHFANTTPYNKMYFDAKGYSADVYTTTIGESWHNVARYTVNKSA